MERALYAVMAIAGVVVIVANKQFVKSSEHASRNAFGVEVRQGTRHQIFNTWFTRILAVVVGAALVVMGVLAALGVIWND